MSLSNVNILRSDGNILSNPLNEDGISGLVIYHVDGGTTAATYELLQASDALAFTTVDSLIYYHISQYFSKSNYALYVLLIDREPTATDTFAELETIQNFAEGKIRQIGVLNTTGTFATTQIPTMHSAAVALEQQFKPAQIIYACKNSTAIASLTDLKTLASSRVSYIYGEDKLVGGNMENLYTDGELVVSSIGLILGLVSSSPVQESIAWVAKYDVSSEIVEPGFQDDTLVKAKTYAVLDALDGKSYIFFRKFTGLAGTYVNFDYVCADPTSTDFSSISLNRVYDKAFRNLRTAYLPSVNSTVYVDKSGKLSAGAVSFFENVGAKVLQTMKDNGEISDFSVGVDPAQKVLVNKQLDVVAKIIPVGVAKTINIKLGFTLSI